MKFLDVIQIIGEEIKQEQLSEARKALYKELRSIHKENYEDKGVIYYYIIITFLREKKNLTYSIILEYLKKMLYAFEKQEEKYKKVLKKTKEENNKARQKLILIQLKAFYKLMDKYLSSLARLFKSKGLSDMSSKIYVTKMDYRKRNLLLEGKYISFIGYCILKITSNYGESFLRWGITTVFMIIIFGLFMSVIDTLDGVFIFNKSKYPIEFLFNYIYFSGVTFTTLGYGDIVPVGVLEKTIALIEAFGGYIMLGMFINLVQKKLK